MLLSQPLHYASTADRLIGRATFGATVLDRRNIKAVGADAWLNAQLTPVSIDDGDVDSWLSQHPLYLAPRARLRRESRQKLQDSLRLHTLARSLYSSRQLFEVMVGFWSNHFNIALQKHPQRMASMRILYDRDVIRTHALGNFRLLLGDVITHPAMLLYLDNVRNRVRAPNENLARELLELHTLGIDGGYTHTDIDEVARILTGWSTILNTEKPNFATVKQHVGQHDKQPKRILGETIAIADMSAELDHLLDLLVDQPATGQHIAAKLVRHFVADDPPQRLVNEIATEFRHRFGNVDSLLRTIFASPEFAAAPPRLKQPHRYMLSALRALDAHVAPENGLNNWLFRLGQPLYMWPAPDGYPDEAVAWADKLLGRWNFAVKLAHNQLRGVTVPWESFAATGAVDDAIEALAQRLFGQALDDESRSFIQQHLSSKRLQKQRKRALSEATALMLASPAFQWY